MSARFVLLWVICIAPLASGCELLGQACPAGEWRPGPGEECQPIPPPMDAGPRDAGPGIDGAVDAAVDAGDAGAIDAGDAGPVDAGDAG